MNLNTNGCQLRFVKWNELNKVYLEIPSNTFSDISIYQTIEYLTITGKGRKFTVSNFRNLKSVEEENIIQYRDHKVCSIAPLLINKKKKEVVLRGHYTSAGQLGFIHTQNWSYEAFCELMEAIQKKYKNYIIKFDRIKQDTLCWKYCNEYFRNYNSSISNSSCVSVCISNGYDAWFESLSKSTRQNIRTSYNRINKANISMQLKFSRGGKEKAITTWKRLFLYSKRTLVKNNYPTGFIGKLIIIAEAINKYADPMTKALNRMEESFNAEVFFDGKLVAFLRGFISEENRLFIPQLTIDSEFGFYSPGGILINETIKYLSLNLDNVKIEHFDLQSGNQPYKMNYGGEIYYNYTFIMN